MIMANRLFYYFSGNEETLASANKAAHQVLSTSSHIIATSLMGKENVAGGPGGAGLAGNGRGYMEA